MTAIPEALAAALAHRYQLQGELGSGGMATVYLALDLRHGRQVAVKVLRPEVAAALGADRFLREVTIAANLQHPHILPVYDSGQANGFLFYVMPFIEGLSLGRRLIREGPLPVTDALRILRDVADALAYAHRQGIVHRDIKPENVMLSDRHALVTDFGVAKAVGEATGPASLTAAGMAVGTPAYMAPEQAAVEPHVDQRADIYAFGAMAYEVLTGRPPFGYAAAKAVLAAHLTKTPEPVAAARATIPPALADLVMRCLEKDPADRWQNSDELLARLEALLGPGKESTVPASPARRVPWSWVLGVLATLVVVAIGIVWTPRRARVPDLDPGLVLVVPFASATESAVDGLGALLENRVKEALQRTGLAEVVDSRTASLRLGERTPAGDLGAMESARRVALGVGAGLVVGGRWVQVGDSLQVEATLVDLSEQSEPARIPAVRTPRSAPERGLEPLIQRVMGALAVAIDPRWGLRSVPGLVAPTFESYREYQAGDEAFRSLRYGEALAHLQRAFALDSLFFPYLIRAAYVLNNAGDSRGVDSVAERLAPRLSRLSEFDRHYLDRLLAWNRGDFEAALLSARAMAAVAPKSAFAAYAAARSALHVNRAAEAVAGLRKLAPGSGDVAVDDYFSDLTWGLHLLGQFDEEQRGVEAWEHDPRASRQLSIHGVWLRVAAAQGWTDSVPGILARVLSARPAPGARPEPILLAGARELRWHGHSAAAATVLAEVLRQLAGQPVSVARIESLTLLGRLDAAAAASDSLRRSRGNNWRSAAGAGVLAAMRNDRAAAERADRALQQLKETSLAGADKAWRARIRAHLGDIAGSVALLREAAAEGVNWGSLHADPLLEPLRDDPRFRELVRPRG